MKIDSILKKVLDKIEPPFEEVKAMQKELKEFKTTFNKNLQEQEIDAELFVGGSFAKRTLVKKDKYDADIFVRFNKKYKDSEISILTEKALKGFNNVITIHGSRDYFQVKINDTFFLEIVPVCKVSDPMKSRNITDLSSSHVKYINKNVKSQKILDDIKLAKAFCHANHIYGAESYINGFSGYSLELLVHYYEGFVKFLKEMVKVDIKKEKLVIDMEDYFKTKREVLLDLNGSKLLSPVILIDPTYKYRNTLAALSNDTFLKFQKEAKAFLKYPNVLKFEEKKTNLAKIESNALKKKQDFVLIETKTLKQEGDIAGSKLLKFYNHLEKEIKKYFKIKKKGFNYNKKNSARYYFVCLGKKEILVKGPTIKDENNVIAFKKKHKDYFTRKGKIYSKEIVDFSLKEFVLKWAVKNKVKIKEMYVDNLEIIE
jgi:tRNA CCA-adding enzyme